MKEIYFKQEAKEGLLNGIQKLHDAVASTMGPNGKTVIITNEYGEPYITKDGVSVAKAISFKDPLENAGAQMIKKVAEKTADEAGDGTTTSIVLATAFIQNLKDFDFNDVNKAFDEIIPKVLKQLKLNSRELKREDIKYVASISANNDVQIGDTIQQAYNHSDIVKVEESSNNDDTLELIEGMQLNVSYFSKHFITNQKKAECDLEEPYVLLLDGKLENLKIFEKPIQWLAKENQSLLIITEHISENVLRLLETNVLSGSIKLCAIKTPGFGQHRKDLIKDLSLFTGATVINDFSKNLELNILGRLKSIKVNKSSSILVKDDQVDITDYLNEIKELKESNDPLDKQRYENLTDKVSIIKVGGGSELEMKERYDRYDDAVKATQCALEEGIVEGGGVALTKVWSEIKKEPETIESKLLYSILQPYKTIHPEDVIGYNIKKDMFSLNIIDPLKVTRCALENAVSVAKVILSTDTIVLNERQWN
jgi:chaperonin GroEL